MHHSGSENTTTRRNLYWAVLSALLLLISAACQRTSSDPVRIAFPWVEAKVELHNNEEKWQNADIMHYRFHLFRGCICEENEAVLIEVKDGEIVSLQYESGKPVEHSTRTEFESWGTMERLFLAVENELNSDSLQVAFTYDLTYGFPAEIASERTDISDDELYLSVSDFEVLP